MASADRRRTQVGNRQAPRGLPGGMRMWREHRHQREHSITELDTFAKRSRMVIQYTKAGPACLGQGTGGPDL